MLNLTKEEKKYSFNLERFTGYRKDRYLNFPTCKTKMISIIEEIILEFTTGKECSEKTNKFINEAIELARTVSFSEGLLAIYKGEYAMVLLDIDGLDPCAIKLTHNEKERKMLYNFYMAGSRTARIALSVACLKLAMDKQKAALIKGKPTDGIIYSNYPEDDEPIDSIVRYTNSVLASKVANRDAIVAVNSALDRGVTEKEILDVIPKDIKSKFLISDWSEYELAQVHALEHGIASEA